MRKLTLIILLLTAGLAYSQNPEAVNVNQLHKRKFVWMITKNYDSLNWMLDEHAKYIHSNGWIQSKTEVVEDMKSGKLNYTAVTVHESAVTLYNNQSAVVTGKGNFKGLMPDQSEFNINLLYTEVYVKVKKQWKLVNRHACKI
jgi:hypothetical protein